MFSFLFLTIFLFSACDELELPEIEEEIGNEEKEEIVDKPDEGKDDGNTTILPDSTATVLPEVKDSTEVVQPEVPDSTEIVIPELPDSTDATLPEVNDSVNIDDTGTDEDVDTETDTGGNTEIDENYGQFINPFTVSSLITLSDDELKQNVALFWVKGYIVGYVNGKTLSKVDFNAPATSNKRTHIVIADSPDERDHTKCAAVFLPDKDDYRNDFNLYDHPENLGTCVVLKSGKRETYFGQPGIKSTLDIIWAEE